MGRLSPTQILSLALIAVWLLTFVAIRVRFLGQGPLNCVLLGAFLSVGIMSLFGLVALPASDSDVRLGRLQRGKDHTVLFVLVHGLGGGSKSWTDIEPVLNQAGDAIDLNYNAGVLSNSDPEALAQRMSEKIQELQAPYTRIVLVAHSMGALLARRAYLVSAQTSGAWASKTQRIVLLAGMNRGWSLGGERPMDMAIETRLEFWIGAWFGRLTGLGRLLLGTQNGSQFVSNLRMDWMEHFRSSADAPTVVQLLGDVDNIVSEEDDKDLRMASGDQFYWLRVRGTNHEEIINLHDQSDAIGGYTGVGPYRQQKLLIAATGTPEELKAQNEEQAPPTDSSVDHIVFVLHGIRDLGRWAADFETQLRGNLGAGATSHLRVVSLRYGYFSMASFLFRPDRQRYVRWFMDQYTEARARYPKATVVDFIGHSNGTYLLASALSQYASLRIRRIVFAGSVVRTDYDWAAAKKSGQVEAMWNYVGKQDAVVALFPRFFEPKIMRIFGNDVGSAGFNGFDAFKLADPALPRQSFANIAIAGSHSAFLAVAGQISDFLTLSNVPPLSAAAPAYQVSCGARLVSTLLELHSKYAFWLVWAILALVLGFPGVRVTMAGGEVAWIPGLLYAGLVLAILSRI